MFLSTKLTNNDSHITGIGPVFDPKRSQGLMEFLREKIQPIVSDDTFIIGEAHIVFDAQDVVALQQHAAVFLNSEATASDLLTILLGYIRQTYAGLLYVTRLPIENDLGESWLAIAF